MKKHGDKIMVKLKDLLNEVAPGYKNRQFGDPLPTLADVTKEYQEKNGVQVEEGQKREASNIMRKYDLAFLKFSREIRDVIKSVDRSTGSKVDGKIIEKAYEKGLIPLNKIMIEWDRGQQENPGLNEAVDETALPMVQALNTLDADIRRADYNKQLEWGAKNPKKVKEIVKAVSMLSKIVRKLK